MLGAEPEDDDDRNEWYRLHKFPPQLKQLDTPTIAFCGPANKRTTKTTGPMSVTLWEDRWLVIYRHFLLSYGNNNPDSKVRSAYYLPGGSVSSIHMTDGDSSDAKPFTLRIQLAIPKKPGGKCEPIVFSFLSGDIMLQWQKEITSVCEATFQPKKSRKVVVGKPTNVQHLVHLTTASATEKANNVAGGTASSSGKGNAAPAPNFGVEWLTPEIRAWLGNQGFTAEDIEENLDILQPCMRIAKYGPDAALVFSSGEDEGPSPLRVIATKSATAKLRLEQFTKKEDPNANFKQFVEIDSGSQGKVYVAVNRKSGERVAAKRVTLTQKMTPDNPEYQGLVSEIAFLAACDHPCILRTQQCLTHGSDVWIFMEYMGGGKLTDLIECGTRFSEGQVAAIVYEVLRGLEYLHGENCMHRDIKSDNVLVSDNGDVKLGDFGFVAALSSSRGNKRKTFIGTPHWMAPEMIQGHEYGVEADIWSLGIFLVELCDGDPPWMDLDVMKALVAIVKAPAPRIKNASRYSKDCIDFCSLALQKNPKQRPTATQLLKHPFVAKANRLPSTSFLAALLQKSR